MPTFLRRGDNREGLIPPSPARSSPTRHTSGRERSSSIRIIIFFTSSTTPDRPFAMAWASARKALSGPGARQCIASRNGPIGIRPPKLYFAGANLPQSSGLAPSLPFLMAAVAGVLLLFGLWTPLAGSAIAIVEVWIFLARSGNPIIAIMLVSLGATVAMIGPGVWSIDAQLYGRSASSLQGNKINPPKV